MNKTVGCLAFAVAFSATAIASPIDLYSNNFETSMDDFSEAGVLTATEGYGVLGYGAQYLYNNSGGAGWSDPSTLTLSLGNSATDVVLKFDLAIIDTWDVGSSASYPADYFNVTVNGISVFSAIFAINSPTVAPELTTKSFGSNLAVHAYKDAAYGVSLNVGNLAAGEHIFGFFASGDGGHGIAGVESWGIDNIVLSGNPIIPVPEPETYALMMAGLCLIGVMARRHRLGSV